MIALALASVLLSPAGAPVPTPVLPRVAQGEDEIYSTFSLRFFGGSLLDDDFEPLDAPVGIGIEYDAYKREGLGLGWEGGLSYSLDSQDNEDLELYEGYIGVRKTWGKRYLHPYVSIGVSGMGVSALGSSRGAVGGYARGGVYYEFRKFNLGVDVRGITGSSFDTGLDSDQVQAGLVLGWSL